MLRRTAFKRKEAPPSLARVKEWYGADPTPRSQPAPVLACSRVVPRPKECAIQNRAYMAAVRELPCARCGTLAVRRVFCHRDETKGERIKTDCREGWPGCPPCHYFVGSTGKMGKEGRREFELQAGHNTRLIVFATGRWPAKLPRWIE